MTKGVSELVKEAESVADSALKGCPAETYALLTLLNHCLKLSR